LQGFKQDGSKACTWNEKQHVGLLTVMAASSLVVRTLHIICD